MIFPSSSSNLLEFKMGKSLIWLQETLPSRPSDSFFFSPWCPEKSCVKLRPQNVQNWTFSLSLFELRSDFWRILRDKCWSEYLVKCSDRTACCSAASCGWKKSKRAPLPKKINERKREETHLPSWCVQGLLVFF